MTIKLLPAAIAACVLVSTAAVAQTTQPGDRMPPPAATAPAERMDKSVMLTDAEAKQWIDKKIYSSDNKNVGEVAAFARDSSGKVTELHADIGGFLGIGETRVRVLPAQFTLSDDRVTLNLTSEQVKTLPKVAK